MNDRIVELREKVARACAEVGLKQDEVDHWIKVVDSVPGLRTGSLWAWNQRVARRSGEEREKEEAE